MEVKNGKESESMEKNVKIKKIRKRKIHCE